MPDGAEQLRAMQRLVQRVWSPGSHWHVGDLAWERRSIAGREDTWRTRIWSRDDGEPVAWGWVSLPAHLDLAVDPDRPELVEAVLAWSDEVAVPGATRTCAVMDTDEHLIAVLESAGYRAATDLPYFRHHLLDLAELAEPRPPDGFTLRHVRVDEASARAEVHRLAWSDPARPSRVTTQSYGDVMRTWPYRAELDWVAQAPDGRAVASALIWHDEHNGVGLVEPVGCAPEFRRRGLAAAVNLAALHALRSAGARTARVCPRGDDGYPVPGLLYRSIGFVPATRTVTYRRMPVWPNE